MHKENRIQESVKQIIWISHGVYSDLGVIPLIKTTNVLRVVIQMSREVCFEEQTPTLGLINLFLLEIVLPFQL